MKIPSGSIVEVHGWVMLEKIDEGRYRIEPGKPCDVRDTYLFFKPRGKRPIIRHLASSVDLWIRDENDPDLNKIVIEE
jgi:hypothetical protein